MQSQFLGSVFETFPVIHTDRLDLIEIKQAHLEDIFHLYGNEKVTRFYNVVTLSEEKQAQKFIDYFISRFKDQAGIRWGIALKGSNKIIGTLGFNYFSIGHRANIGYDLLPQFWNKGYGTEALKAVIEFGFHRLGINRIEAEVMVGNVASESILKKLGFQKEGLLRQWMYWNAQYYDMNMFSLLRSDLNSA